MKTLPKLSIPNITLVPRDCCPRCYLRSERTAEIRLQVRFLEHMHLWYCPMKECGYEVKESSAASRLAFMDAQKYIYLHPKRGRLTIVRTK